MTIKEGTIAIRTAFKAYFQQVCAFDTYSCTNHTILPCLLNGQDNVTGIRVWRKWKLYKTEKALHI